ncbi:MAG: N-acetyl-alpha-D-glucosaminyl L-malate synthase BshA [Candidatus Kariarchaeaceae archaeon]
MKILITGFPTMGGSGLIATRLGLQLAENGHEIHFLFYKRPFLLGDRDKLENITFHQIDRPSYALFSEIGAPFTIQSAAKIVKVARSEKIELLHSHYAIPHAVSSYLASNSIPLKTIVTTHGSDTHTLGHDPSYNEMVGLALKNTTCVTSVSNFLARETETVFKLPSDSVKVIYDFVDTQEFKPESENRSLSIVQASNFRPVKQVPLLVEIFSKVVGSFPSWSLNLIGNGPEWPLCLRKVRELKIKDNVNFLGVQTDIPKIFSEASILASSSKIESFGLTIAEGMACETPIWAPDTGGIPELCVNGETGFLYNQDDISDAVEKLSKLMENEDLRRKFGRNGRERINRYFSTEIIVKQFENLYKSALNS